MSALLSFLASGQTPTLENVPRRNADAHISTEKTIAMSVSGGDAGIEQDVLRRKSRRRSIAESYSPEERLTKTCELLDKDLHFSPDLGVK